MLKRTSFSPNIKERMDASCAIFDAEAQLVAQAEHVPVHLGSMLRAVRADAWMRSARSTRAMSSSSTTRSSAARTCPTSRSSRRCMSRAAHLGYVATRAHHADIGGMEPGSMPGKSREVYQEGIIIPAGQAVPARRASGRRDAPDPGQCAHPGRASRRPQRAARGDAHRRSDASRELARRNGADLVTAGFAAMLDYAERRMRRRLAEFPPGTYYAEDFLDDDGWSDEPVAVALAITVSPEKLVLDFAGSSPQRPGNINAVAPMTYSASFFAIKVLTDPEVPVNAGTFRSVEIKICRKARSSRRVRRPRSAPATPRRRSASPTPC